MDGAPKSIADAFAQLSHQLQCSLIPDHTGAVRLRLKDDVVVAIEAPPNASYVFLHSIVDRLNNFTSYQLCNFVLHLNLFKLPYPSFWLALDQASQNVTLCHSSPIELINVAVLSEMIAKAYDCVLFARETIHHHISSIRTDPDQPAQLSDLEPRISSTEPIL